MRRERGRPAVSMKREISAKAEVTWSNWMSKGRTLLGWSREMYAWTSFNSPLGIEMKGKVRKKREKEGKSK